MAPPGRRRGPRNLWLLSLGLFFLFTSTASAASAVLGIDLGTEYLKAALVKPGIPLEIVLTKDSKRKETAAIAFKPAHSSAQKASGSTFPERLYGSDAVALAARFPADVYPNLKPLLGHSLEHGVSSSVEEFGARYPEIDLSSPSSRNTVAIRSKAYQLDKDAFSVEELLAMQFQNVKGNAETMAGHGTTITDAVITVPAFFTAEERRAVDLAADLAGLKVLGLVSDGLAVGLNYATSRTFKPARDGGVPEYNLVFDMGAGSTTATLLSFQGLEVPSLGKYNKTIEEVKVLGTGWDKSLGGDAFNAVIVDHIVQEFVQSSKASAAGITAEAVRSNGRAAAKLWKEAERVRQVLSANSETGASFEGLFQDVDFRFKITRSQFEELAESFAERVAAPVKEALQSSGFDLAKLNAVILHGGASRTPFVQKHLEKYLGGSDKIKTNVNADEAAVFGAVFHGAGLSPSFRVKEIRPVDNAAYPVALQWRGAAKLRVFEATSEASTEVVVPVDKLDDFSFDIIQELQATDSPVASITTQNLTASVAQLKSKFECSPVDISTNIVMRISATNGIPEVVYGNVSCEVESLEKKGVVDDVKDFFGFGGKKDDQEALKEDEKEGKKSTTESSSSTETTPSSSETESSTTSVVPEESQEPKKRTEAIRIKFSVEKKGIPQPSKEDIKRMKKRLADFDGSDKTRKQREESFNSLEGFTYRARDLLTDDAFIESSTDKERSSLETKLQDVNEWLYGDGSSADKETLDKRLKDLKSIVKPVETRQTEGKSRPKEIKSFKEAIEQSKLIIKSFREQSEKKKAEEESAAAAAAAAESSTATTASEEAKPSAEEDEFAELEDSTTESTNTKTKSKTKSKASTSSIPTSLPEVPAKELDKMDDTIEKTEKWLEAKIAEQEKLAVNQDPVLTLKEIDERRQQISKGIVDMMGMQYGQGQQQKGSGGKSKPKSSKSKSKSKGKGKSKSSSSSSKSKEGDSPKTRIHMEDGKMPSEKEIEEGIRKAMMANDERQKDEQEHDEL